MLDWQAIDTVLLDMDGTLLDLHYDNHFWMQHLPVVYAEQHKLSQREAQATLDDLMAKSQGQLNWYCLDYWSQQLSLDINTIKRQTLHKIKSRPHTLAFLQFLREQGKQVVMATNAHRAALDLKMSVVDLRPYFDRLISAHDFGSPKEDQLFWQRLTQTVDFDPARTLFVDDNLSVLESAKQFGIQHLLAIHQPDSQTPRRVEGWPAIDDFDEIIPDG